MRELSRRLQRALLPRNAPRIPGYDIAGGTIQEEDGQGSSIWDWFPLPDGRFALATLDVAPGTFPAAHAIALVRAFLRELPAHNADVETLLERVNSAVSKASAPEIDVCVECGVLVLGSERVSWLCAGVVPGGVVRRAGVVEELPSMGPPLGLLDGFYYGARDLSLGPGDVALVLSHGARGLFRGAADVAAELHGKPAGEVVSKLQSAIRRVEDGRDRGEHSILFVRKR